MKQEQNKILGYVIFHIWQFEVGPIPKQTLTVSPNLTFQKKFYLREVSAKEAVEQMKKQHKDVEYFILPVISDQNLVDEMWNRYYKLVKENNL
jgi:hypothetical protein